MARPEPPEDQDLFAYVELRRAQLCLDCEAIFQGQQCPACSSQSFVPVTRWIQPAERPEPKPPVAPAPPPASRPKRFLRNSLYLGLGAYGVWRMLFEPPKPRKRKMPVKKDEGPSESPG